MYKKIFFLATIVSGFAAYLLILSPPMKLILAVTAASGAVYARPDRRAPRRTRLRGIRSTRLQRRRADGHGARRRRTARPPEVRPLRQPRPVRPAGQRFAALRCDDRRAVVGRYGRPGSAFGRCRRRSSNGGRRRSKQRRRLILCVRETPLSLIHLRNLTALAECGAVVLPPHRRSTPAPPTSNRSAPRSPNASSRSSAPKPSITNGGRSLRPQTAGIGRSHTNRRSEPSARAADTEPSGSSGGCLRSRTHAPSAGNFRPGILYFRFFL